MEVQDRPTQATATRTAPAQRDGQPIVVAQRLTKVFKDFWMRRKVNAVNELDFEIRPGQVFGLIGPNGSGKSTTIKMILGLLHKTGGRLAVFGKPPETVNVKRRIGYLPEESYLYPFLNARETLDFYGKLFGLTRQTRQRRIDELLDMVGLDAVQFRAIGEYSKGMQRRIGIAQALINDPDFLILDEPTSGLDPIGIRQVKDLILHLGERGKTILLSSHLLADVEDVCDYMVILYGGRKQQEGTREQLLTQQSRTVIETEALDDAAVEDVRRFITEHEKKQVIRVSPARQSLESLFLDIVERAQQQRIETFGARAGGQTAAFLRGEGASSAAEDEGEALLERLTRAEKSVSKGPAAEDVTKRPRESVSGASAVSAGDVDKTVLESLVAGDASAESRGGEGSLESSGGREDAPAPKIPSGSRQAEVDESVLQSLVEAYGEDADDAAGLNTESASESDTESDRVDDRRE